jgi:plastocyanin
MWIGLAIPLVCPFVAQAAPPAAGLLVLGAVGQTDYGTIKGRLVWGGATVPPMTFEVEKGKATNNPDVCAKNQSIISHKLEVDPKTKGIAYGYAYVVRPKGANPELIKDMIARHPNVEIDQKNCDFVPHSVAILQDQTLTLKSSDPVGHNVRLSGLTNTGINQTVAPNGKLDVKLVAERLPMFVKCDIHPWMHGHVMVFDHPFFAVTGADGSFEIKGVPAGSQNVVVWQEMVGYVTPGKSRGMPVNVEAGKVTDVGEIKMSEVK